MTMIDDTVDKEKLLENFPLSELELDRLIAFYNVSDGDTNLSLSEVCQLSAVAVSNGGNGDSDSWLSALRHVEEVVLPEASPQRIRDATQFVSPLLPYDVTDDEKSPLRNAFYFLEAMVSLLGRRGGASRFLPNFVYDMIRLISEDQATADADALVDAVHRHVRAALYLQNITNGDETTQQPLEPPSAWVLSLNKRTAADSSSSISRAAWNEWVNSTIPEAMQGLSTFYHYVLFATTLPFGPLPPPQFALPQPDQESHLWNHRSDHLPLSLRCMSPAFGGTWHRLFSSDFDGSSFLSFQNAILGYPGPTVLMVRRKGCDGVFGYYTDCPWKESNDWFGGDSFDSFLFKVDKSLAVFYPTYESNGQYMYLNSAPSTTKTSSNNTLRGLAIGGIASDTPRVHLTTSFENCIASSTDTTYTSGPLVDPETEEGIVSPSFDVDTIEVWAVNVSEANFLEHKAAGQKVVASRESARQRVAQVDRAQFLDHFQSSAVSNLFGHREEARGRHDFVASQDGGGGYFVEAKPPSKRHHSLGEKK